MNQLSASNMIEWSIKADSVNPDQEQDQQVKIDAERKKITTRGVSGLQNLGNTCYQNAAYQCLFATLPLTGFFSAKQHKVRLEENCRAKLTKSECKRLKLPLDHSPAPELDPELIHQTKKATCSQAYYITLKNWYTGNYLIIPESLNKNIGQLNKMFYGHAQQDSHEFLNFLLNEMHDELRQKVKIQYKNIPNQIREFETRYTAMRELLTNKEIQLEPEHKRETEQLYFQYINASLPEYANYSAIQYWTNYINSGHSVITDIFTGLTVTETKCESCSNTTFAYEPYTIMSIAIPSSSSSSGELTNSELKLVDCLKQHTQKHSLFGDNRYQCTYCKDYHNAIQNTSIWELPDIFIIQLKRFSCDMMGRTSKNSTNITFPLSGLNLRDYMSEYNKQDSNYELYGIIQQHGSLNGGHYIATCKNAANNKWYEFDDGHVTHIPKEQELDLLINKSAYILFYKRVI